VDLRERYPLNGLRLENTTELNLMQGPITVFEEGTYAGDAQLPDVICADPYYPEQLRSVYRYDPKNLDRERFQELFARHGSKVLGRHELIAGTEMVLAASGSDEDPALLDEFARCEIEEVDDLMGLFVPSFYFGCEADDPLTPWAFDTRRAPGRVALNAVYGSDIGHWDVPDMSEVMHEVVEPLDEGLMSPDDFRAFVFENPVRLHAAANPSFFEGTVVEEDVRRLLASES